MRKIFSMIMVALVALFVTSSCKLENGNNPDPDRANNLLWWEVNNSIHQHYDIFIAVAFLNDTMLEKSTVYDGYRLSEEMGADNIYTISYSDYGKLYRIKTDGKRLDEGGEWSIYLRLSNYEEYMKLGVVKGIVGESSKFNLLIEYNATPYYYINYTAESEMEYEYDKVRECLCVKYNTFKGVTWDASSPNDYAINFEVVEPLVLYTSIETGKINILYKDLVDSTSRQLSVVINNKITTFATPN